MKYKIFFLVLFVLVCLKLAAQKQHFDVYQYVEPKGWVKEAKQGMVLYTSMDEKKGTYCIIGLSVSQSSKGDLDADFDAEWIRIILPLGVSTTPQKQVGEETKGWKLISGTGTFETAGAKSTTLLNTFSGHNKAASVFFTFNNGMYQKALEEFSNTLELITPEPMVSDNQPAKNVASSGNSPSTGFSYTIPKGWSVTKNSNGAESISSPLLECKEYSYYTIRLSGTSTYTGSLQEYAHNLHKANFYQQNDWRQYMEGDKRIVKGIDANGHEFLTYETSAALFNSDRNYHYGMVYLVRSGNQLISILLELNPINSDRNSIPTEPLNFLAGCNALKSAWNKFITSVKFTTGHRKENYVPDDLLGKWESRVILGATNWGLIDSRILEKYTFMEDGRYQSQKMMAGNNYGKYSVNGNTIAITDAAGKTSSYRFKLESLFEYGSWHRELTLYDATGKETTLRWEGE